MSSVLPEGNKKDRDKKAAKEKGLTKTTSGGPRGPGKLYIAYLILLSLRLLFDR